MIDMHTRQQLISGVDQLKHFIEGIEVPEQKVNCITCNHFDEESEICGKYKMRPPARTIVEAGPEWDLDIPF